MPPFARSLKRPPFSVIVIPFIKSARFILTVPLILLLLYLKLGVYPRMFLWASTLFIISCFMAETTVSNSIDLFTTPSLPIYNLSNPEIPNLSHINN